MIVNLEVVGIFFKCTIDLPGPLTVKSILDAAKSLAAVGKIDGVSDFGYDHNDIIVTGITCTRTKNVNGRVTKHIYGPGVYSLESSPDLGNSYNIWQYYVLNPNGTRAMTGFLPYNDENAIVPDGGSLIWRLVSILKGYPVRAAAE